jgi:hypothetical protein
MAVRKRRTETTPDSIPECWAAAKSAKDGLECKLDLGPGGGYAIAIKNHSHL